MSEICRLFKFNFQFKLITLCKQLYKNRVCLKLIIYQKVIKPNYKLLQTISL